MDARVLRNVFMNIHHRINKNLKLMTIVLCMANSKQMLNKLLKYNE